MDAKPQRPMRALRIHDENMPQLPATKSIHHRNKSTPALSALMQAGAIKAAAVKKPVLGDKTNNGRFQGAKDDSQLPGKGSKLDVVQDTAKELVKPTALLHPAQRPLATNSVKPVQVVSQEQTIHTDANPQAANIRKVLTKKATAIFKETYIDPNLNAINGAPAVTTASTRVLVEDRSNLHDADKDAGNAARVAPVAAKDLSSPEPNVHGQQPQANETRAVEEKLVKVVKVETRPDASESREYVDALEEQARVLEQERNDELAKSSGVPTEEYWDEDDEEEYYEADGYTTAHSLLSHGNNTTGGVTLVLVPKATAKVQRELDAAKLWVESHQTAEDVEDEQWDTSMVAEYGEEIFDYMRSLEDRMKPNPQYMDHQAEIQWSMRSVLMDWLVQVHHRFTLLPETLFLAVNYVDRFLSCKVVSLGKLQLVGATALFVAAKYEEINCPSVQEIVYMVDGAYTIEEILKAERFMLSMLQFELGWPGPMSFLRRISKADDYDLETRTLAKYFLELTVMDERFVGCAPSFLSAGAHCLARFMLKKGDWSLAHVHYAGYTLSQLRQLVSTMLECCENPQKHHAAVYDKYTDKRYKRASMFVQTELTKGFQLPFANRYSIAGQNQLWKRK